MSGALISGENERLYRESLMPVIAEPEPYRAVAAAIPTSLVASTFWR